MEKANHRGIRLGPFVLLSADENPPIRIPDDPYGVGQETRELADTELKGEGPADSVEVEQTDLMEGNECQ